MARSKELGIKALAAVHFYVNELDRFRRFWVDQLDFAFVAASTDEQQAQTGMRTEVYEAGRARYVVSQSVDPSSEAGRWMVRHPDGVGELIFEVDDVQTT